MTKHLNLLLAVAVVGVFAWSVWAAGRTYVAKKTAAITTSVQTAWSGGTFSVPVANDCENYRSYVGDIIIRGPIDAGAGTGAHGAQCSAYIALRTIKGFRTYSVDSGAKAGFPCTLHVDQIANDTLIGTEMWIGGRIADSLGDSIATLTFEVIHNITMKE